VRRVQLQLHIIEGKQTTVENFPAEEWDDFVLIRMKHPMDDQSMVDAQRSFQGLFSDKKVIILSHDVDVEFYGLVEVDEYEERREQHVRDASGGSPAPG